MTSALCTRPRASNAGSARWIHPGSRTTGIARRFRSASRRRARGAPRGRGLRSRTSLRGQGGRPCSARPVALAWLLRGSGRGGLERHQTMRATVSWSYQLLDEAERALFDRLSVFAGTFDADAADAAESVATGGVVDELDVVDLSDSLVDKSMVVAERQPGGVRYRLLETLRQYGEERLTDRDGPHPCVVDTFVVTWRLPNAPLGCGSARVSSTQHLRARVGQPARRPRLGDRHQRSSRGRKGRGARQPAWPDPVAHGGRFVG